MKHYQSIALAALFALAACGPSRKERIKQRLLDKCVSQAASGGRAPDAKMQGFIKEYCSCLMDKFEANLSADELDSLDRMKDPGGHSEIYQRLSPLVEQCAADEQEKIRKAGAER